MRNKSAKKLLCNKKFSLKNIDYYIFVTSFYEGKSTISNNGHFYIVNF